MAPDASDLTRCCICHQVSEPVLTCHTGASGTVKLAKKEAKPAAAAAKKTEPKEEKKEKKEKKPAATKAKTATKAKAAPKAKATATVCSSHALSHFNC